MGLAKQNNSQEEKKDRNIGWRGGSNSETSVTCESSLDEKKSVCSRYLIDVHTATEESPLVRLHKGVIEKETLCISMELCLHH